MSDKMNLTLLADFYELTMANGYWEHGIADQIAYYDLFFRKVPDQGGFAIMELFCGGKGFNQAVALARAGCPVCFAGAVGEDGQILLDALRQEGIDDRYIKHIPGSSGHAVIQVDPQGQNCILILAGANGEISKEDVDAVLADFGEGDLIVLQNEISQVEYILTCAAQRNMIVALNPSPCDDKIAMYDLNHVDYLLINEGEGYALTGMEDPKIIGNCLRQKYPRMNVVLTLGSKGAMYFDSDGTSFGCGILRTHVVDTTAAGDTFTGYFLAQITKSGDALLALEQASIASGISVTRKGAFPSIPKKEEVAAIDASILS